MIVSETDRSEGVKVTFVKDGAPEGTSIGEAITCFINGERVIQSEGNTVALPIKELSTVEFRGASYYRATKYLDDTEKSVQVTLFPLPTSVGYHSQEQMLTVFEKVLKQCPTLASVYDIGKSHKKRVLQVLRMSAKDSSTGSTDSEKQSIKLVGGKCTLCVLTIGFRSEEFGVCI